jgi:hypothetical protein
MLDRPSSRVQDCYRRADECAQRAETTTCAEQRAYWDKQEARWVQIAGYAQFSERVASYLRSGKPEPDTILQEDEAGLDALVDIFNRVCAAMNIDARDTRVSQAIAQVLVKAATLGICDPEILYNLAMQAALE